MTADLDSARRGARAARRAIPRLERQIADGAITDRAIRLARTRSANLVSSYLASDGEPDLSSLHHWCATNGVDVAVPVMGDDQTLEFRILDNATLEENRSGILEPVGGAVVDIASIEIVFTPLVLFDDHANRAGRGGGWYDNALAGRHGEQVLAGVAYECQRIGQVPTHAGDIPLDMVLTDLAEYHRG